MYLLFGKRLLDFLAATLLLILFFPAFLFLSVCNVCAHKGRVWFRQERIGKGGRSFRILKFRTMNNSRSSQGELLSDRERTTSFGSFLRRYSIDELPQLVHVLTGRISFIGPRPLIPEQVKDCTPQEFSRHDVRPGITGLAQVRGRNELPFRSRFRYDVLYARRVSIWLDVFILVLTFRVVLAGTDN